jgi:NADPH:quinone reductase-like Zn-dependent oxidoreductase
MKAAVLYQFGTPPRYDDFPDPVPADCTQLLINVKAAAVKNLDKGRASGLHYARHEKLPDVVGIDGVGTLSDGQRVYAPGITGMIAEKALIEADRYVPVPDALDDIMAAALPNAVLGSAMALKFRAGLQQGNTVLVNGATGVTGQVAVQIARHFGAARVIATGRNPGGLKRLKELGVDEVISLEEDITARIREIHKNTPIDVVIDYLWGPPAEKILDAVKGGGLHSFTSRLRYVTVGAMAGESISVPSSILRSSAIEILGSGIGSISKEDMRKLQTQILPEMFQLAAEGKLKIATQTADLKDIETAWNAKIPSGERLVIRTV